MASQNRPRNPAGLQELVVNSPLFTKKTVGFDIPTRSGEPLGFLHHPRYRITFYPCSLQKSTPPKIPPRPNVKGVAGKMLVWTAFQKASGGPGPRNASACGAKDGYLAAGEKGVVVLVIVSSAIGFCYQR